MTAEAPDREFVGRASPVLWSFSVGSLSFVAVAGLLGILIGSTTDDRIAGVLMLVVGIVAGAAIAMTFRFLTLRIEGPEVVVHYGTSPFRSRYRLTEITDVDTIHVTFWRYGGFGYRGSRRLLKRAAIIVRTGEAVQVHLADGSRVAVTVDDASDAAEAIRAARGG